VPDHISDFPGLWDAIQSKVRALHDLQSSENLKVKSADMTKRQEWIAKVPFFKKLIEERSEQLGILPLTASNMSMSFHAL
jgi:hypothetical protein